ncbi:leucine-rich repeat domain-containing protein [Simkania sp.]|uniref:leucine-rich repeat domain-containing protein n=1 Tax=Simkania sp. TaxID=34094 RepID=UPI003B521AB2
MASVQHYQGGYYVYPQTHFDLRFQVTAFGANRIREVPTGSHALLSVDQGLTYVKYLLELYKAAILTVAKQWRLELTGTSLEVSEKFSQLIVKSGYDQWTELSLKGFGLSHLPPQIGLFKDLKELDISGNNLTILFPELPRLERLEVLDISGNKVGVMLPDLSGLLNLRILRANGCGLGAIPEWIDHCPKLERVELRDNHIEENFVTDETSYHLEL